MDKIKRVKAQLRLQQWAERISECQVSTMTVAAWCEAHDINIKTYYYWLRKVREATVENLPVSALHMSAEIHQEPAHFKKLEVQSQLPGMQAAVIVQEHFHMDPFSPALYIFCGRKCDRIKALLWEGDGFLLLYKRIENGKFQ